MFRQPSGSDEGADAITLHCSQKRLRVGSIRSPAALPRMAVRGRAFLSEHADDNRSRYDKGGLSAAKPTLYGAAWARFALPTLRRKFTPDVVLIKPADLERGVVFAAEAFAQLEGQVALEARPGRGEMIFLGAGASAEHGGLGARHA